MIGVLVGVFVRVPVTATVPVGVFAGVFVGVFVPGTGVLVGVFVGVFVAGMGVLVRVLVGVLIGPAPSVTMPGPLIWFVKDPTSSWVNVVVTRMYVVPAFNEQVSCERKSVPLMSSLAAMRLASGFSGSKLGLRARRGYPDPRTC
jgi:hypothetical protein